MRTNKPQATYLLRHPSSAFYPCSTSVLFSVSSVRDLDRPRRCNFSVVYLGNQKEHSNQTERVNEEEIGRIQIHRVLIIDDKKKKKTESDLFIALTFNKTVSHVTFLITRIGQVLPFCQYRLQNMYQYTSLPLSLPSFYETFFPVK